MATVVYEDGWYTIYRDPGEAIDSPFRFQAEFGTVFWNADEGFYYIDVRGRHSSFSHARFGSGLPGTGVVSPKFTYALPTALDVKPAFLWPRVATGGPVASYFTDSRRWVRVTCFINRSGGFLEIPLLDTDGIPFLGPSIPPPFFVRKHDLSTDRVTAPATSGIQWDDIGCYHRQGAGCSGATAMVVVTDVFPKLDPVPHWVLRVQSLSNQTSSSKVNVLVDFFGQAFSAHSSATVEVGSGGAAGHYKVELMWGQQAFMAAGDRAALNTRLFHRGAVHINDGATGTIYLTTGANQGLSTGTNPYGTDGDDLPCVVVFGNSTTGSDVTGAASSTWEPETWGLGLASDVPSGATGREKIYNSALYWEGATSRYRLDITNEFYIPGGPRDATKDRTFFPFAFGRP